MEHTEIAADKHLRHLDAVEYNTGGLSYVSITKSGNSRCSFSARRGGATIGAGRDMSPPLLRDVPRRGDNPIYVVHLRGTTAGR